ncbi:MAG: hypothetical protein KDA81_20200 [Planctomycetaceae bacterium]|nr:hypothetical protein [Planctomycetaceae bacterium]
MTIEQLACGNNIVLLSPASAQVYTFSSLLSFAQQKSFLSPTSILAAIINQNGRQPVFSHANQSSRLSMECGQIPTP